MLHIDRCLAYKIGAVTLGKGLIRLLLLKIDLDVKMVANVRDFKIDMKMVANVREMM